MLTGADLPSLLSQPAPKLFARKFDIDVDGAVLDTLDANLGRTG
ncbi:MAG: hypothetical protein ACK5LS_10025 [Propioniciclava sp.]